MLGKRNLPPVGTGLVYYSSVSAKSPVGAENWVLLRKPQDRPQPAFSSYLPVLLKCLLLKELAEKLQKSSASESSNNLLAQLSDQI